jgi:RHS repeat-associated protein
LYISGLNYNMQNTRVTYSPTISGGTINYMLENVVDYYPYGKVLRAYQNGQQEKYLFTQHERDKETGYDNLGARLRDAEVIPFLSLDPKAMKYPSLSPYNYVANNPISFIDPDGGNAYFSSFAKNCKDAGGRLERRLESHGYSTADDVLVQICHLSTGGGDGTGASDTGGGPWQSDRVSNDYGGYSKYGRRNRPSGGKPKTPSHGSGSGSIIRAMQDKASANAFARFQNKKKEQTNHALNRLSNATDRLRKENNNNQNNQNKGFGGNDSYNDDSYNDENPPYGGGGELYACRTCPPEQREKNVPPNRSLDGVIINNPQFINLPEGSSSFIDWANPRRVLGAPARINYRMDGTSNVLPGGNARFNVNFTTYRLQITNSSARWDVGGESAKAFRDWFNGDWSEIDFTKIYFRWPALDAYPTGSPGGWNYGVIEIPK